MQDAGQRSASGGGWLPLTARSNGSFDTPRTAGGGYTARSSGGERGTPRDAQRFPLGERPREYDVPRLEGWQPQPISSPQHTGRSTIGCYSSDWSRTPSSEAWTDRSRIESVIGDDAPLACQSAQVSHEASKQAYLDLQKSLEVMRFVIMRENQKLRDSMRSSQEELEDLQTFTRSPPPPRLPPPPVDCHEAPLQAAPHRVQWLVNRPVDTGTVARRFLAIPAYPGLELLISLRRLDEVASEACLEVFRSPCPRLVVAASMSACLQGAEGKSIVLI
eukprot:TRINITY_DN37724_c0_g1_i1.p1 TRINITY_DN37724_c0_g1~~TRINITY_DN37724_c0_g1_i1.p1  ORF type:complete len:276 (+),score=23.83 TRINITY_DN37724_c0_g1_i1:58-885(+)